MIKLAIPSIDEDDINAISKVLRSCQLVQGEQVSIFEEILSQKLGGGHVIAVSSGTAALHLALLALDIQPGDFVIVPTYSFPATANVVEVCGATPVFVDITEDDFTMDPKCLETELERLFSEPEIAKKVRAIMVVHAFGTMADLQKIIPLANKYNLPVIEDAACSLGATLNNIPSGRLGTIGCFSFHPRKVVTTGEGGAIVTSDESLARKMKAYRNHGQEMGADGKVNFIVAGLNYRMTEFQAALGQMQLNKLDSLLEFRRNAAAYYDTLLASSFLRSPVKPAEQVITYQSYVTLLSSTAIGRRDHIIKSLKALEIETTIGTHHIPMTSYYRNRYGYKVGDFPVTDYIASQSLTLPLSPTLTKKDQERVVEQLRLEL